MENGHNPTVKGPPVLKIEIVMNPATGQIGCNVPNELLGNLLLCELLDGLPAYLQHSIAEQQQAGNKILVAQAVPPPRIS